MLVSVSHWERLSHAPDIYPGSSTKIDRKALEIPEHPSRMDAFNPSDFTLPPFLDPVLDFLADHLPPPLYDFLFLLLSHTLALCSALISLITNLVRARPWEWDAETILPPLIMVLASYLALLSFYRTTSWMIRTGVWFVKWGTIIGALAAGAGYFMGTQGEGGQGVGRGGAGGGGGILGTVTGLVLDMMNGQGQNAAGNSRSTSSRSRSRTQQRGARPKAWESFDRHRDWQYSEGADGKDKKDVSEELRKAVDGFAETLGAGTWWEMAKGYVNNMGREESEGSSRTGTRKQPSRKAKSKAQGSSGSR